MHTLIPVLLASLAHAAAPAQTPTPNEPAPERIQTADALLTELESAHDELSVSADLLHIRHHPQIEGGGVDRRFGKLRARTSKDTSGNPERSFRIDIDQAVIDGRLDDEKLRFVFTGDTLWEFNELTRTAVERPLARGTDPFSVTGQIPIPIAQRKADVLGQFSVTLLEWDDADWIDAQGRTVDAPPDDGLRDQLEGSYQLLLEPRPGAQSAELYTELRVWYDDDTLLPVFVRKTDTLDAREEFRLTGLVTGTELPADTFDTTVPAGWQLDRRGPRAQARASTPTDPPNRDRPER